MRRAELFDYYRSKINKSYYDEKKNKFISSPERLSLLGADQTHVATPRLVFGRIDQLEMNNVPPAARLAATAAALDLAVYFVVQLLCGLMRFQQLAIRSGLPRYRLAGETRIARPVAILHDEHPDVYEQYVNTTTKIINSIMRRNYNID